MYAQDVYVHVCGHDHVSVLCVRVYTFKINFDNPVDCRWHDCQLPTSISATRNETQMTVAIYVR